MKAKLQTLGRAMLIPLALITIAGLFMGLGGAMTSSATIKSLGLEGVIYKGSLLFNIFIVIKGMGDVIFANLPILYASGVAFGMAKREQGWAAFSGIVTYLSMHAMISIMFSISGISPATTSKDFFLSKGMSMIQATEWNSLYKSEMGYYSYRMGVFGGFMAGVLTQYLHNKLYNTKLPTALSFFAGTRTVPVVSSLAGTVLGIALFYIWPVIGIGLASLSLFIGRTGLLGTFIWAISDKGLLPLGIHHLITTPMRWTELGGTMMVDGVLQTGTTGIQMAQLASSSPEKFLVRDFQSGRVVLHFGGLVGAAYAIYKCAKDENKAKVGGILLSSVFTMLLFGITEPIEFTFLFVSPLLFYIVHVPLTGLAFVLCEYFQVSWYGGNVKDFLPVLLQLHKTRALPYLFLIPLFFVIYYFLFKYLIIKFNIMTPGREDNIDVEEIKLYTKSDYNSKEEIQEPIEKKSEKLKKAEKDTEQAEGIIAAFGGKDNIEDLDNCISRLRVVVKDASKVAKDAVWKEKLGARGVVREGVAFQIIYGPHVTMISVNVRELLENN